MPSNNWTDKQHDPSRYYLSERCFENSVENYKGMAWEILERYITVSDAAVYLHL